MIPSSPVGLSKCHRVRHPTPNCIVSAGLCTVCDFHQTPFSILHSLHPLFSPVIMTSQVTITCCINDRLAHASIAAAEHNMMNTGCLSIGCHFIRKCVSVIKKQSHRGKLEQIHNSFQHRQLPRPRCGGITVFPDLIQLIPPVKEMDKVSDFCF